jgi:hypothetical protein
MGRAGAPHAGDSKAVGLLAAAGPRNVAESQFAIARDGAVRRRRTTNTPLCRRLRRRAAGAIAQRPTHAVARLST